MPEQRPVEHRRASQSARVPADGSGPAWPERRDVNWSLRCSECGRAHPADSLLNTCEACDSPLLVEHDLAFATPSLSRQGVDASFPGLLVHHMLDLWPVLPLESPRRAGSLWEGGTPLYRLHTRCTENRDIWVKDESRNPTGTFKARGMFVALNRVHELGVRQVVLPSAGNAAGAAAAYAARLGMKCYVVVPEGTPEANLVECHRYGATVLGCRGSIFEAGQLAKKIQQATGAFNLSTLREPYRVEGKKTMGYELYLQCQYYRGNGVPDVILYPTGGGTGLIGIWKAYLEMRGMGWPVEKLPRLIAVQAEGCAPVVKALREGATECERWQNPRTIASGLRVPYPAGGRLILRALRETNGTAVAVSDEEIVESREELSRGGYDFSPESAACWAAYKNLAETGEIDRKETVVLLHTGTGLKYSHLDRVPAPPVYEPEAFRCEDLWRHE